MNPPDFGDLSDFSSSAAVTLTFVFQNEIYHENRFSWNLLQSFVLPRGYTFGYPLTFSATSRFVFSHIHLHFLAEWAQNMYSLSWFPVDASYRLLQIFMLPRGYIVSAPGFPSCSTSRYVFHIVTLKSMYQQHFLTAIRGSQLMIPYDLMPWLDCCTIKGFNFWSSW